MKKIILCSILLFGCVCAPAAAGESPEKPPAAQEGKQRLPESKTPDYRPPESDRRAEIPALLAQHNNNYGPSAGGPAVGPYSF